MGCYVMLLLGMDALDFRIGSGTVNESMQAASLVAQWREINATDVNVCVGGIVFEYVDEW